MTVDAKDAIGKPFIARVDGEIHELGTVKRAALKDGRLMLDISLHDPSVEEGWKG